MKIGKNPIRVVIVEDSASVRELLVNIFKSAPGIHVVGTGTNGLEAIQLIQEFHPDVVMMDLRMPKMDGLEAVRQIMRQMPTPIVMLSEIVSKQESNLTFKALQAGALAVIRKPGLNDPQTSEQAVRTVRLMAGVPVIHHWGRSTEQKRISGVDFDQVKPSSVGLSDEILRNYIERTSIIGIAASTGGPSVLEAILGRLPKNFPTPIIVVQHISKGFDTGFASWLGKVSSLEVEIAAHGDRLQAGRVFIAPDDYHLIVGRGGMVELTKEAPHKGFRPSADYMFSSIAEIYGRRGMGIILTGMGNDGVAGLEALHKAGGIVVAQDEQSCVVYGMPKEAVNHKIVDQSLNSEQIFWLLLGKTLQNSAGETLRDG